MQYTIVKPARTLSPSVRMARCPSCGKAPTMREIKGFGNPGYQVYCPRCKIAGDVVFRTLYFVRGDERNRMFGQEAAIVEAIRSWNRFDRLKPINKNALPNVSASDKGTKRE